MKENFKKLNTRNEIKINIHTKIVIYFHVHHQNESFFPFQ